MKARIDQDGCIACGLCVDICPSVFQMAPEGYAVVIVGEVPSGSEASAVDAEENCPVSVITVF